MKTSKVTVIAAIAAVFFSLISAASFGQKTKPAVIVGGAPMYPSKNIVENAMHSKDHTTLVAAVKAAGLVKTLSGPGPYTVFAPTNEAFDELPKGTVASLLKPENKKMLTGVLTYHVVSGSMDSKELMQQIKAGNGKATLKTVQGESLMLMMQRNSLWIMDAKGNKALVTIKDVYQSNGVIHVINKVLMP